MIREKKRQVKKGTRLGLLVAVHVYTVVIFHALHKFLHKRPALDE